MTAPSPAILVIGGLTIDTLRLPGKGKPLTAPGGAGLYTALAIRAAGGRVRLFAQRPVPMPEILLPYDQALDWIGPEIPPGRLPRLDIVHFGGGRAELAGADWGAQPELDSADLPGDLAEFTIAHIAPLGPTAKQIEFAGVCRSRGAGKISAGTYGRQVYQETESVRALVSAADYFFMNENEARGLFSDPDAVAAAPGQILFVTRAERGAWAVPGDGESVHTPAVRVEEYDPTGAGDSFCGAALAAIARGGGLAEALAAGVQLAARTIQGLGPEELILRSPA